ncbi:MULTISPECIES: DUF6879 family protein [Streptomyces]|uniref:DUF6879 domain-containing protein n=1 Tax=Streptomyces fradiae ATCC 10745 = DSM 40063 TaxID=1319510 RepID=A0A1Y2NTE4_STRFR|nr:MULTISPECIES: DUF6879 family protein [Streptomyces]KAF0651727.1 hypothetical protein K701_01975 [Streptomyces fradiae ATCC 10745 = DSM 40063]OSY50783.1 hypothetical protein BG846_03581 [Streptomyces fradiae ATCC 10745 = DSM 40063]QEV11154.1 hypothetical protein CP974_03050 [Streptomyces fradiae ATCC 10745 = DSM 40063]
MSRTDLAFVDLLANARRSAVHLELRDSYGIDGEAAEFTAWRNGWRPDPDPSTWWNDFHTWVRDATKRGVVVRRARVVSEPVSDYIRYEHACTFQNIAAGESVRWLSRRKASDVALPGNDFWLFDGSLIMWNHFTGDGASAGPELDDRPDVAKLCASAFEAVWERATPHEDYRV